MYTPTREAAESFSVSKSMIFASFINILSTIWNFIAYFFRRSVRKVTSLIFVMYHYCIVLILYSGKTAYVCNFFFLVLEVHYSVLHVFFANFKMFTVRLLVIHLNELLKLLSIGALASFIFTEVLYHTVFYSVMILFALNEKVVLFAVKFNCLIFYYV